MLFADADLSRLISFGYIGAGIQFLLALVAVIPVEGPPSFYDRGIGPGVGTRGRYRGVAHQQFGGRSRADTSTVLVPALRGVVYFAVLVFLGTVGIAMSASQA